MNAIRVETTIEQDGELHLKNIPCRKGDRVEAIVLVLEPPLGPSDNSDNEERRQAAEDFLKHARASKARSTGPYPKRDELYDRKL